MKKLLIIVLSLSLAFGASAQRGGHLVGGGFGHGYYYGPSIGFGFYAPFYSPFYPYPYGYGYGYGNRPTKMSMQVSDITNDYKDKIWSVRHDTSLTHKQRKQKVHELKVQRDKEIADVKKNYYKH